MRPIPLLRRTSLAALATLLAAGHAAAQASVEYDVRFPNRAHHEAQVTATFRGVPAGQPLQLRMSRSSPGRYALHEFAKNVYAVRAADGQGRTLAFTRADPHQWDVAGHDGTVTVHYTVFGDRADGTYAAIDASHAHLNAPATFMWARGMENAPIRARFERPDGWKVATQLVPTADSAVFTAPNLQYFLDSPVEVSPWDVRSWTVPGPDGPQTIRLVLHHLGTAEEADRYADKARKVVAEQIAVFGEAPRFDFGTYTFLADYLPWVAGDGMEHRNSTVIINRRPLAEGEMANLGTLSHEFFHAWNVERIRPAALEPFDFTRANMSGELWFAEGFTSYYDDLFIRRAGLLTDSAYAAGIGGSIVSPVVTAPGRRYFSAVEMSMQAPFVDAASSIDPHNRGNTFLSYYTWGSGIGLGLDLTLRTRFPGVTLDDYMRAMWREFGRAQTAELAPARPYTLADLRRVLGEVTRDPAFANDFFDRYIEGPEVVDYAALLARAGFLLRKPAPGRPWLGVQLGQGDGGVLVDDWPLSHGSVYQAGLSADDVILSLDGRPTPNPDALRAVLDAHRAGDVVAVEFMQRGHRRSGSMTLAENPALEVVAYEVAGMPVTAEMRAFRGAWLGSRAGR
ncbi:M61 family metallopeptidase [Longimicrobium sp.]|uniref:M61 family metallopeptidase n=1 Tax=Longimicrobium sp. TaxID=2029185 RepID=UPI003B3A62F7